MIRIEKSVAVNRQHTYISDVTLEEEPILEILANELLDEFIT